MARNTLLIVFVLLSVWLSAQRYQCFRVADDSSLCGDTSLEEVPCDDLPMGWRRIAVRLDAGQNRNEGSRFCRFDTFMDKIELYGCTEGAVFAVSGKLIPPQHRSFPQDASVVRLTGDSIHWLMLHNYYPTPQHRSVSLEVLGENTLARRQRDTTKQRQSAAFSAGWLQGALLVFALFPLMLYIFDRKPYYIYYILFVLLTFLNDQLEMERFSSWDAWVSYHPEWFMWGLNTFQLAAIAAYVAFFRAFLGLSATMPRLNRWLGWLIVFNMVLVAADVAVSVWSHIYGQYSYLYTWFYFLGRFPAAFMAVLSIVAIQRLPQREVRYVGLGVFFWMLGITASTLAGMGKFSYPALEGIISNPYIFIHIGVLLELTCFSAALGYKNRKHIEERILAEQASAALVNAHKDEKDRIARDLHDEVGSTLTTISILSEYVQQQLVIDNERLRVAGIGEKARMAMSSMSDIVWAVNPQNDDMESIVARITRFAAEALEPLGIHSRFHIEEEVYKVRLTMEQRKDFYLIAKEAITNITKHSHAQTVAIAMKMTDGRLQLTIEDDGDGLPPTSSGSLGGNGLNSMRTRAAALGGELVLENGPVAGTALRLWLPI